MARTVTRWSWLVLALAAATCGGSKKAPAGIPSNVTVTFLHSGVAPGPALITDRSGNSVEERRYEPYGEAIDSLRGDATVATVGADHFVEPFNSLNKETDATTGWSYHGARWMSPGIARWLSPDPPVKAPDANHLAMPWDLNPYQFVRQNPTLFWDPDGQETVSQLIERKGMDAHAGGGGGVGVCVGGVGCGLGGVWGGACESNGGQSSDR